MASRVLLRRFNSLRIVTQSKHSLSKQWQSHVQNQSGRIDVSTKVSAHNFTPVTAFHTSVARHNEHIINIQDEADFKKRVIGSETPVIVDFHATYVLKIKLLLP